MKLFNNIYLASMATVILASCSDILEKQPLDTINTFLPDRGRCHQFHQWGIPTFAMAQAVQYADVDFRYYGG